MTELLITKTKLQAGIWHGIISGAQAEPSIAVTHLNRPLEDVTLSAGPDDGTWALEVKIPAETISDGMQTFLITDQSNDTVLDRIVVMAGEAFGDDLRAEVDLLRAELDMLKRAFRRHCLETS